MLPSAGRCVPTMVMRVLVLPAPLCPTRPTNSPSSTCIESPVTARTRPYATVRSSILSTLLPDVSRHLCCALLAQIRRYDLAVGADLLRRAERHRLAEVEHLDVLADTEDHAHVVLDEQHAAAVLVA